MITKITPYKLSKHSYEHRILVALDHNPMRQRVLISLNNAVAEGIYNPKTKSVTASIRSVAPNKLRDFPFNSDIRVKVFVYDSFKDKIIEAKLQEFAFYPEALHFKANDTILDTPHVIMDSNDAIMDNYWLF